MTQEDNGKKRNQKSTAARKKPYVKPACASEQIYETLALACGKVAGQSARCNAAPKAS